MPAKKGNDLIPVISALSYRLKIDKSSDVDSVILNAMDSLSESVNIPKADHIAVHFAQKIQSKNIVFNFIQGTLALASGSENAKDIQKRELFIPKGVSIFLLLQKRIFRI